MGGSDWQASLPKKRMAAGALFFAGDDQILIVKPTYRDDWLVPGGVVEDGESPRAACMREVREEIGLDIDLERLLCVDYGSGNGNRTESLHFVFYGGQLTPEQVAGIRLPPNEISEFRTVSIEEAMMMLAPRLARRTRLGLRAVQENRTVYAEDGMEIGCAGER